MTTAAAMRQRQHREAVSGHCGGLRQRLDSPPLAAVLNAQAERPKTDWHSHPKKTTPTMRATADQVIGAVATWFAVKPGELLGRSRSATLVNARCVAVLVLMEETEFSVSQIGRYMDNRDHTTIGYLNKKALRLRMEDDDFRAAVRVVASSLQPESREAVNAASAAVRGLARKSIQAEIELTEAYLAELRLRLHELDHKMEADDGRR